VQFHPNAAFLLPHCYPQQRAGFVMVEKITSDRGVKAAKPATDGSRRDYSVEGSPGLQLRVTTNAKLWSLIYRRPADGKQVRHFIGEYPAVGLADAKTVASEIRTSVKRGADPAADRREEKNAFTFEKFADRWLKRHAQVRKRSWREDERMLKHDVYPAIGAMRAAKVTRTAIVKLIDGISDRGAPYQANRVLVLVRTIFNWGIKRGDVPVNPAASIEKPGQETKRTRALNEEEVRQFWIALDRATLSDPMRIIIRLSLLLGQRLNELALARKIEFDLAAKCWNIPGTREMPDTNKGSRKESGAKNKRNHPLPLSGKAVELLHNALEWSGESEWLFPSPTGKGPIGDKAASRAWGRARDAIAFGDLQARDLRRSFATIAGSLGFNDFDIGLVLNHATARGGITSIYNRAEYLPEKAQVIEAVERRLFEIVEGREPTDSTV
jgi:integrase